MVRKTTRRGKPVLVLDILYSLPNGTKERYRKDAQVQTATAAREEDRRLLGELATTGKINGAKAFFSSGLQALPPLDAEQASNSQPAVAAPPPVAPPPRGGGAARVVSRPAPGASEEMTFGATVELWRKLGASKLKATTRAGYEKSLSSHLLPRFKDEPVLALDRQKLAPFEADMIGAGLADQSRNNIMVALRSIVRFICELHDWPLPRWSRLLPIKQKHYDPPSAQEIDALLRAAPSEAVKVAIALAAYGGLRAGEVRGLRPGDVDLKRGMLTVRQTLYYNKIDTPKSGHERQIPLGPALHRVLEEASRSWTTTTERVSAASGKPRWTASGLRSAFLRTLKNAALPGTRFHGLRHFFISRCFEGGADAPTVQRLAGHGHLSVTQRYAHTRDERLRQAVQIFG